MNKIAVAIFIGLVIFFALSNAGESYFGKHELLDNDTLGTDSTWYSDWIDIQTYPYVGIGIQTSNPADSTVYDIFYVVAFDTTDTFFVSIDSVSNITNLIFSTSDSASTYMARTVTPPVSGWIKIKVVTDATDHGERCKYNLDLFTWTPIRVY